jgi:hypothetical protein
MAGYDGQRVLRVDRFQRKFQIHELPFIVVMENPYVARTALIIDTWTCNAFFRMQFNAHDPNILHDKTKASHGFQVFRPGGEEYPIGTIPDFPKAEKEQLDVEIRANKQVYSKNRYETIPESRHVKSVGKRPGKGIDLSAEPLLGLVIQSFLKNIPFSIPIPRQPGALGSARRGSVSRVA